MPPHNHLHDHFHAAASPAARRNIRVAFLLNTFFALVEIAGGLYTNSVAILSDALHDFGDSISLGIAYYFQKKSERKSDRIYSYGYGRFSLLGALVTSGILVAGSLIIIIEAVERFSSPAQPDARGMILFALLGVTVNFIAMMRLRSGSSINEKTLSLHFIEDVLGWLAVLAGGIVMLFVHVPWLDPLLSLGIAVYILSNVYRNVRSVIRIVLQGVPRDVSEEEIRKSLLEIPGIRGVEHFHVWTMDGLFNVLTIHVLVDSGMTVGESEMIRQDIRHRLAHLKVEHATIELEAAGHVNSKC